MVSRIKIMAELNIAEKRLPQDGRVGLVVDGRHVDLRVVTLPSVHGEGIVMRVLDKASVVVELDKLGMADPERERFEKACRETHGCVLVTGPTGSGKSTTLYAALKLLNTPEKNIITVEDPVEYEMDGLTQVQVAAKVGLTFAMGLRSMVRADPDIIMVGEVRDRETAQIAVESALTGHLVLSTLHTNDAPSAITRLIEMGVEPVPRRLGPRVRRCSAACPDAVPELQAADDRSREGRCRRTAFQGPRGSSRPRTGRLPSAAAAAATAGASGMYEVMQMSPEIPVVGARTPAVGAIRVIAIKQGMTRLRDAGCSRSGSDVPRWPRCARHRHQLRLDFSSISPQPGVQIGG